MNIKFYYILLLLFLLNLFLNLKTSATAIQIQQSDERVSPQLNFLC